MNPETISDLVRVRSFARKYGDSAKAIGIEAILDEKGVDLNDGPYGTTWQMREDIRGVLYG